MNLRMTLAAVGLAGALALPAGATPVVIQNGFVQAGVSDSGTLGSNGNTSPGILYDPTGSGSYGINDFLTPGSPFEGLYVSAAGYYDSANNECVGGGYNEGPCGFTKTSPTSGSGTTAGWTGSDGTLSVTNNYSLTTLGGKSVIAITTSLTNISGGLLSGVDFLRTLDPDPDVNAHGSFFTNNALFSVASANDEACGTGPDTGETICIISEDSGYTHQAGVSGGTNACEDTVWDITPSHWLSPCLLNDGDGDYSIGEAFSLGDLGAGDTDTLTYDYVLGGTLETASGPPTPTGVPEPGSAMLLLSSLMGLGVLRRRRK
ncbi:MAG TPA: PEP-CTERM sorting domain-containing protein [Stellaceae bacterium]|nr:PEP-CTERM sorting domain-containing protein [Stellaceae bacterium]